MVELGEGCPLLKEVLLSHCHRITDVGIAHLVTNCTLLESCHMVYCPGVTAAGVATVVSSCPNIKKVLVEKWKVSQRTKRRAGSVISYLCMDLQIQHQSIRTYLRAELVYFQCTNRRARPDLGSCHFQKCKQFPWWWWFTFGLSVLLFLSFSFFLIIKCVVINV